MNSPEITAFNQLALSEPVFKALEKVGYENPSPIQAMTIPLMLDGKDVIGQAQTGTGKTAAFALPLLSMLDIKQKDPQILVLTPTRELAIQVAEAFQTYASFIKGFHVLPVYGGQDFRGQLSALKRGAHIVVGTPGRVMDHMRRGTLKLQGLKSIVLDEADEMLRMGFIDDVEWILEQAPEQRQIALFSATMPTPIRRIATAHLHEPEQITIAVKTVSADTIRQRYWPVRGIHKLDALTRILEAEQFNAMIVFVRTKTATVELADKLSARGFASSPLNGDMTQQLRERTVEKLKKGALDILVATDVAARGLDVERISHVINYDIPYDVETYIHRIGRTGRAGREGDAILFVAPRERRLLGAIEKATRKPIEVMELPTTELINTKRIDRFKQQITDTLASEDLSLFTTLVEQYQLEHNVPAEEIAAALARLAQGSQPLLLEKKPDIPAEKFDRSSTRSNDKRKARQSERGRSDSDSGKSRSRKKPDDLGVPEQGMDRFKIQIGHQDEVKPGNIVGAIANEAGIDSQYIGRINIFDDYSLVDLPEGMPKEVFQHLKNVWIVGKKLNIEPYTPGQAATPAKRRSAKPGKNHASSGYEHRKSGQAAKGSKGKGAGQSVTSTPSDSENKKDSSKAAPVKNKRSKANRPGKSERAAKNNSPE